MTSSDRSQALLGKVEQLLKKKQSVRIVSGNSKNFYGRKTEETELDVIDHRGIIHYEPTELIITARCGTTLDEIETELAKHNQILAFEPPHFGKSATLGGTIACGLSGPRRPFSGAARDFVLGMTIINGKAEKLHFGGEVMKNVAGYDISRLMTGSLGTLGIILDVSLKVLPKPDVETSISFELSEQSAINKINKLCGQPLPISAACYDGNQLFIRVSGNQSGVSAARKKLGGETIEHSNDFWKKLREQTHSFFRTDKPVWRLSVAPATPPLPLEGKQFIDWGGAQRWLVTDKEPNTVFKKAQQLGGHATLFRNGNRTEDVFQPLTGRLRQLHMELKLAFDPNCLFNPGRMYLDF